MLTLIRESQGEVLKGVLYQAWDVGSLAVSVQISNRAKFNHFGDDVEECLISYRDYRDSGNQYDGEETGYRHLIAVCDAHSIPYSIADNGVGQMLFYIPSEHKMSFLQGLEAHLSK